MSGGFEQIHLVERMFSCATDKSALDMDVSVRQSMIIGQGVIEIIQGLYEIKY